MRLLMIFLMCALAGCKASDSVQSTEKQKIPIDIVFSSDEAIKRVPYKLSNLSFSLTNSITEIDRGYSATIFVNPDHIDSILEKIRMEDGVKSVRSSTE